MSCAICEKRRPRRYCPGVRGEICPVCCGTEREVTVRCPSDCEYLIEARKHERSATPLNRETLPHQDIPLSEEFLGEHADLIASLCIALRREAARSDAVDSDAREAIESLIQTYRTLQSGLLYAKLPANPLAANLHRVMHAAGLEYQSEERERMGISKTRDADILRVLVFLDVLAIDRNNGRKFGRAFLDTLPQFHPEDDTAGSEVSGSSLILP
jgi:hypothetical protein